MVFDRHTHVCRRGADPARKARGGYHRPAHPEGVVDLPARARSTNSETFEEARIPTAAAGGSRFPKWPAPARPHPP